MTPAYRQIVALLDQLELDEFKPLSKELNGAWRRAHDAQGRVNAATINVGDTVRLSGLKPAYLNGQLVKVTGLVPGRGKINVSGEFITPVPRQSPFVTVPASCCTVVPS
jgi:hypothetical protein